MRRGYSPLVLLDAAQIDQVVPADFHRRCPFGSRQPSSRTSFPVAVWPADPMRYRRRPGGGARSDRDHPRRSAASPSLRQVAGLSLHAARVVPTHDRDGLEKLCRYGLRAPLSQERLSLRADGRVVYHLRRPWPNAQGATCLVLDPNEFLRRLAALAPAPYANLVRYHGVFASRSRWRARLPEPPGKDADPNAPARSRPESENQLDECSVQAPAASPTPLREVCTRRRSLPWAQLLRRVFFLDALTCPRCSSSMLVLALLSEPEVVRKILLHLELGADVPALAPAVHTDLPLFDDDIPAPARPPP